MRQILFVLLLGLVSLEAKSQKTRVDSLSKVVDDVHGQERLQVMNEITSLYLDAESRKALPNAKKARTLADNIIKPDNVDIAVADYYLRPEAYVLLGRAFYAKGSYLDAKNTFESGLELSREVLYSKGVDDANFYLAKIDSIAAEGDLGKEGIFKRQLGKINLKEKIGNTSSDIAISTALKLASSYEKSGNYEKAIAQYEKALNLLSDQGDVEKVALLRSKIASLHQKAGNYKEALALYKQIGENKAKASDSLGQALNQEKIDGLIDEFKQELGDAGIAVAPDEPIALPESLREDIGQRDSLKQLAQTFEEQKDYKKSLDYYKLYLAVNEKLNQEELELLEKNHQIDTKAREIMLLKQEQEVQELEIARNEAALVEQKRLRNHLIIGALLLTCLAAALYFLFRNRKRAHNHLKVAYDDLEVAQSELATAEKKIKTLLHQQVSGAVADALLTDTPGKEVSRKFVCIMFLDIRGFTPFAEVREPEEIIQYQNDVFGFMIDIINEHGGIINQFMGDGFMATFGAPVSTGRDCDNAYESARKIIDEVNKRSADNQIPATRIGIGLHAGQVVTGNVGTDERKQYSITGNTVIIAARIEQLNKNFNSQLLISEEVFDQLSCPEKPEPNFKEVNVKGRKDPIKIVQVA
ncbi:MAG: adenylate/guanylate cyclase domain-containing protein [Bacteroidota bacterium]